MPKVFAALTALLAIASVAVAQETVTRSERAFLSPLSVSPNQYFGGSVASDSGRAVVGANGFNSDTGAATVFERGSSNSWSLTTTLFGGDSATGDRFGEAVALDGDVIAVGAPEATGSVASQGAVYVFLKVGSAWPQIAKLTASDGATGDLFGTSVALKGDTIVVGAPGADVSGGVDRGAAYVFRNTGGSSWSQEAKLIASNGVAGDQFGGSVATRSSRALVGASEKGSGAGAAYLFRSTSGVWTEAVALTAGEAGTIGYGRSVALSGTIAGDWAFVGAPNALNSGSISGAAFVYQRATDTSWPQAARLAASDGAAGDGFGLALAAHDDRVVVASPSDTVRGVAGAGSAYAYRRMASGAWQQGAKIAASSGAAAGSFGGAVSLAGERVMVGAPDTANGAQFRGAVYHFKLDYVVGSLDDNGRGDIFWFNPATGGLSAWSMNGLVRDAGGSGLCGSSLGSTVEFQNMGDFYGDGRSCALYREKSSGAFRIRRLNGLTVTDDRSISAPIVWDWRFVALTDVSGDGKADVILRNALTNQVNAWIMDGHTKTSGGTIGVAVGLEFLGTGDLDGDGRSDLLWREASGAVRAWFLNGVSLASDAAISGVGAVLPDWRVVSTGDFDGDGDKDILWRNITTGALSGWRMQSSVRQQGIVMSSFIPLAWRVEAATDLDADGTDDLVWRNMQTGDVNAWRILDFTKVEGGFVRNVAFSWSCLNDDDYNDDHGWDGNGDDDNGDDSNGDDWNDDHGGSDADDDNSGSGGGGGGGNETVSGTVFNNSVNAALAASSLPILEAEVELEGGVTYVQVLQWNSATSQFKLVVVRTSNLSVVYSTSWTPTADQFDDYADAISVLGQVTRTVTSAVNQALSANLGTNPHSVELQDEDVGPVWKVEIVRADGTLAEVSILAN
ncbi:MAG: FG-GAP-like repeat-containing protein [Planctomycetaceae bacterium]|nr:FG-GAP-like repeat-containing protein [Planctomycetaceae bacterium]